MKGRLALDYDPDDRYESARIAAIVRGDDERLRTVLWDLCEELRRVARGEASGVGGAVLDETQARRLAAWVYDLCDGVPLSLE